MKCASDEGPVPFRLILFDDLSGVSVSTCATSWQERRIPFSMVTKDLDVDEATYVELFRPKLGHVDGDL